MELEDMDQEYIIKFNWVRKGLRIILWHYIATGYGQRCQDCTIPENGDPMQPSLWKFLKVRTTKTYREEWRTILGIITGTGFYLNVQLG